MHFSNELAQFLQLMSVGLLISCSIMVAVWSYAKKINNAGIVDVAWCAGFTVLAIYYAVAAKGDSLYRVISCIMTTIWSLRLSIHLFDRVKKLHPKEDGRYAALRKEWGTAAQRNLFIFFQIQAISMAVLSAPMLAACQTTTNELSASAMLGIFTWLIAVCGESLADQQLKNFTCNPDNKGKTCDKGLWGYSRHPNYFFEWLTWIAYFIFSLSSPLGVYTIFVPLLMLHFLLNVTGVKLTEEHALKSRGDEYRRYQERTSPFIPWFKRVQKS